MGCNIWRTWGAFNFSLGRNLKWPQVWKRDQLYQALPGLFQAFWIYSSAILPRSRAKGALLIFSLLYRSVHSLLQTHTHTPHVTSSHFKHTSRYNFKSHRPKLGSFLLTANHDTPKYEDVTLCVCVCVLVLVCACLTSCDLDSCLFTFVCVRVCVWGRESEIQSLTINHPSIKQIWTPEWPHNVMATAAVCYQVTVANQWAWGLRWNRGTVGEAQVKRGAYAATHTKGWKGQTCRQVACDDLKISNVHRGSIETHISGILLLL